MSDARKPWATLEPDGVHVHLPMPNGSVLDWPCTPEGAYELIGELASCIEQVKGSTDLQKKIGAAAVGAVVDWFGRNKS